MPPPIEKNEAGWGRTRAMRRRDLDEIGKKVREVLEGEKAPDTIKGVVFLALEVVGEGPRVVQASLAYGGKPVMEALVLACDEVLTGLAGVMIDAERAKRESIVRGKRGGGNGRH